MNKPCPNCGSDFDREQGNFWFWTCGTWSRGRVDLLASVSPECTAIKLRNRRDKLEAALKLIYDKAEGGSEIRDIAGKALK